MFLYDKLIIVATLEKFFDYPNSFLKRKGNLPIPKMTKTCFKSKNNQVRDLPNIYTKYFIYFISAIIMCM